MIWKFIYNLFSAFLNSWTGHQTMVLSGTLIHSNLLGFSSLLRLPTWHIANSGVSVSLGQISLWLSIPLLLFVPLQMCPVTSNFQVGADKDPKTIQHSSWFKTTVFRITVTVCVSPYVTTTSAKQGHNTKYRPFKQQTVYL